MQYTLRPYQREICEWAQDRLAEDGKPVAIAAPTACHGVGEKVLMFDGSIALVENIRVGDSLMGPDGKPRRVLTVHAGVSGLYEVLTAHDRAVFTGDHLLCLWRTACRKAPRYPSDLPGYVEVPVESVYKSSAYFKHLHYLYKSEDPLFCSGENPLPIKPYILGLWLGGGTSTTPTLTTMDPEIECEWSAEAERRGLRVRVETKENNKACMYHVMGQTWHSNSLLADLRSLNLLGNKRIPKSYLSALESDKFELLAGLIDTDGYYANPAEGVKYEITQKNYNLAMDIVFLCRSLGLRAEWRECQKTCQTGATGTYYRIVISGNAMVKARMRLPRKQFDGVKKKKSVYKFSINPLGSGQFVGFTVDGDNRYLDDEFFVVHNCGKTHMIKYLADSLPGRTAVVTYSNALVSQYLRTFPTPAVIGSRYYRTKEEYEAVKRTALVTPQVIFNPATWVKYCKSETAQPFDNILIDEADACLSLFRILAPKSVSWTIGERPSVENVLKALHRDYPDFSPIFMANQHKYWWEVKEFLNKKKELEATLLIHDVCLSKTFAQRFFPRRVIGLSGTMFPSYCRELFGTSDYHYYEAPSPIPVERRRIEYFESHPDAISYPSNYPEVEECLRAILAAYPQRPAIVHVSYSDTAILQGLNNLLKGYHEKGDKLIALEAIAGTDDVLLAGGAVEGLDLAGDKARLNIILRGAFPMLMAPAVMKRLALSDGQTAYNERVLRAFVQAAGRTTRGPDDYSVTVVADNRLARLIKQNMHLIPQYCLDACTFLPKAVASGPTS